MKLLVAPPSARAVTAMLMAPARAWTLDALAAEARVSRATLVRPLGALIFGYFGDSLGRRQTTLISVAGFSVVTLLIALLQGYEARVALALRH